ncbi:hypothetical protein EIN_184500 [Entamoeba invadens IP1]|uniref:hypothetical protein n=1 Tax=Entamoeba invadens IP1 TaxID=370355 RepID=UPI0002C3D47B|nr:hypothetical protein EIN_184500 [Entamoeba invadens IP1]ELP94093.1 hypothetical protein EIN_184500 [Entamoeba invadens IP1]|eukprot:XP_004260864.1 hypothetical protein EIN_184500 [Entamoeba invadens IP1]
MPKGGKKHTQEAKVAQPAVSTLPIKDQQNLPRQQDELLKAGLKHFNNKHYEKAIENVEKIIARFPQNGEAVALLAASQYSKSPKTVNVTEIIGTLKLGIRYNLGSVTCWHLYALILKLEKNYEESCKAFKQLSKIDQTNLGIKRELYCLQVHTGDFVGAFETRAVLYSIQSDSDTNLLAKAVTADLVGHKENALELIQLFIKNFVNAKTPAMDKAELMLYECRLYKEIKKYEEAQKLLVDNEHEFIDKIGYSERLAELKALLGEKEKAIEEYKKLLSMNADKLEYYINIAQALGGEVNALNGELDNFVKICKEYSKKDYDNAAVMILRALPANEEFKNLLKKCMIGLVQKHIITVYMLLASLFEVNLSNEADKKKPIFVSLLDELEKEMTGEDQKFVFITKVDTLLKENKVDDAGKVFENVKDEPNTIEGQMITARVLKHQGKLEEAANAMDRARNLDLADRYLANRTSKYFFRSGNVKRAVEVFKLFDRSPEKTGDAGDKFNERMDDLEVVWFLTENACGQLKCGNLDEAEKLANRVLKAYKSYVDDLFDFHAYIFQKPCICTYIDTLKACKQYVNSPFKARAEKVLAEVAEKRKN